ncbi:MAG: RHS repeat-associated core domain-containing protein [Chitinophagaceae bacterium]
MHYYPFGLTMAGISSKALNFGDPGNNKKYNGIEKNSDFQIDIYETQLRVLDGQIGRWWQIDPKVDNMEMWSPYASNYDNPINYMDPLGDESEGCCKWLTDGIKWINNNLNPLVPLAEFVTGKSLNSNFTESKSRLESGVQLGTFLLPTAKVETIIANEFKNVIIGQVEKQITKNAAKGAAFEKVVVNDVVKSGEKNVVEQVTIKANNGVGKTKMDVVSRTESGAVKLREVKASETAPLRPNQKTVHKGIAESGGTVVGKGKPGFPGGTQIPPTVVEVVRPKKPF